MTRSGASNPWPLSATAIRILPTSRRAVRSISLVKSELNSIEGIAFTTRFVRTIESGEGRRDTKFSELLFM